MNALLDRKSEKIRQIVRENERRRSTPAQLFGMRHVGGVLRESVLVFTTSCSSYFFSGGAFFPVA